MIRPLDILNERENRAFLQEKLINKFKIPLLVVRVNYPGLIKNNKTTKYISKIIYKEILSQPLLKNKIKNTEEIDSYEGKIYLLNIDLEPIEIKKLTTDIESKHSLGRLVDLDVIDLKNHTISRRELNLPPRSCFICNDIAHNCVRSSKHSLEELTEYIENIVNNHKKRGY